MKTVDPAFVNKDIEWSVADILRSIVVVSSFAFVFFWPKHMFQNILLNDEGRNEWAKSFHGLPLRQLRSWIYKLRICI
jgi:hypothetical protein